MNRKKILHFSVIVVIIMVFAAQLTAQNVRPVRDDIGFCWNSQDFQRILDYLRANDPLKGDDVVSPAKENEAASRLIAGISPHDDYLYAGPVYYQLFKRIRNVKEVVIFGVTHGTVRKQIGDPEGKLIFDTYSHWKGPDGPVEISKLREYLKQRLDPKTYLVNDEAHNLEHSIEAMIPFLQASSPQVKITPIMVTAMDFETMESISRQLSSFISAYIRENGLTPGKDIIFLISADANHYGMDFNNVVYGEDENAHRVANERDKKIAETCLAGEMTSGKVNRLTQELWGKTYKDVKDTYWCGKYSIPFGMLTVLHVVENLGMGVPVKGRVYLYTDTYTDGVLPVKKPGCGITATFSLKHWVGFFSAGYYISR